MYRKFINKQWWRYRQAWQFYLPLINVIITFMWAITTIVLTGWFIMSLDLAIFLFIIVNIILWITGYVGDKNGFWQEWGARNIMITNTEVQFHLMEAQAALTARPIVKAMGLDITDIEASIEREKLWFEKRGEEA